MSLEFVDGDTRTVRMNYSFSPQTYMVRGDIDDGDLVIKIVAQDQKCSYHFILYKVRQYTLSKEGWEYFNASEDVTLLHLGNFLCKRIHEAQWKEIRLDEFLKGINLSELPVSHAVVCKEETLPRKNGKKKPLSKGLYRRELLLSSVREQAYLISHGGLKDCFTQVSVRH